MRSFEVSQLSPSRFVEAIQAQLAARGYDRYVSVDLTGEMLGVAFKWMGTTRFSFRISPGEGGFRAELVDERVSPFHAAFRDRFEGTFEEALNKVGATVV